MSIAPEEFDCWIRDHTSTMLNVARDFLGDHDTADDVVQDVWAAVWTARARIEIRTSARGWLLNAVLSKCRDYRRRQARRKDLFREWFYPPSAGAVKQPSIVATLTLGRLWRAVAELPDLRRKVFIARYVDGQSTKEIARDVNKTEGTVKSSLFFAKKTLREVLGEDLESILDPSWKRPEPSEVSK